MKFSIKSDRARLAVMLSGVMILLLASCNQVRNGNGLRATAPGFEGSSAQARNAANPNGPMSGIRPAPHLAQRATLLDATNLELCQPTKLTMSETQAQSSGSRRTLRLSLINAGEACKLGGFPAVTLLGPTGKIISDMRIKKVSATRMAASIAMPGKIQPSTPELADSTPSPQIMLPANGEAEFQIGWTTGSGCEQVSRIAVAAPGTTRSILIGRPLTVCDGEILLTAVGLSEMD